MVDWMGGTSSLSICAFCYMLNLFTVVVFYRSMVNQRRGTWYILHAPICETYLVVVVFHRSMINWRRGQLI